MSAAARARRVGLLINPIAGMGGRVALKGTDGPDILRLALSRGAKPLAPRRAARALAQLFAEEPSLTLLSAPAPLGAQVAQRSGLATLTVDGPPTGAPPTGARSADVPPAGAPAICEQLATTRADTQACALALAAEGVDLLMFAGGDGTARDIVEAIGDAVPLLGIPTGVKMHSGVFASTAEAAGRAAAAYLRQPRAGALALADIADVDEEAARAGRAATRLYGHAHVPRQPAFVVSAKVASPVAADMALDALCAELARSLPPDETVVLGPGTTTARVLGHLGLAGTLLGVDAVRGGALVGSDLSERELLALLDKAPNARLLLGVIGGQGSLLGRGNQQLSPAVLRRIGVGRIEILAALDKLLALQPAALRVDTGEDELDRALCGYRRVCVAPGRTMIMRVST